MTATLVTVAIPALDEAAAIGECLDRVRSQTWPDLDIVVADGGSTDATRSIVLAHAAQDARVRLVDNPRRLQSAGLNTILESCATDLVVRLDARSFVAPDYVERCVDELRTTQAAVVGGQMVPRAGASVVARGIARANVAWWGAGPARFHRGGAAGPADTVYLGAFDRTWLDRAGGWAEDVGVNEDFELNHRIRHLGGVVWLDPTLEVGYQPRSTLRALARQYFRYGRSKAAVARRHPESIRPRQVVPALFPLVLLAALAPSPLRGLARPGLLAYLGLVGLLSARGRGAAGERIAAAAAAVVMHWSWALGLWLGAVRPFARAAEVTP